MRYATKSSLSKDEILDRAEEFFKKDGLVVTDGSLCRVCLEKDGGFVTVQVTEHDDREVIIMTEGYDVKVKAFMKMLSKEG
ncbi:MAG: hypothetical protein A4E32_01368 [Methanomassiliicoccales archaeon PtaU1.Bin124]|nr:MAG: hypothetical protein A4E32_01368 [Methanomassiliicoccales archaeon PtaU1.Bin124]